MDLLPRSPRRTRKTRAALIVVTLGALFVASSVNTASAAGAPTIGTVTANGTSASVPYTPDPNDAAGTTYTADCTGSGTPRSGSGSSPISVDNLSKGATYTCTVTATDGGGGTSSAQSNAFAIATTPPSAPTGVSASQSGPTSANVNYTPSADGGGASVSYSATCSSSDDGSTGNGSGGSPITVGGLTKGKNYTCTVTADNGTPPNATSNPSGSFAISTTAPSAPTGVSASLANNTTANVTYTPSADDGGAAVAYTASCSSSNGGPTKTGTGASAISVTGLGTGFTYSCTVTADNGHGTTPSAASAAFQTVPNAPTIGTATPGNGAVTVNFTTITAAAPILYTASCTSSDGGAAGAPIIGANTPLVVTGLTNGNTYKCTVKASTGVGVTADSAPSNPVVPTTLPGQPVIVSTTRGNGALTVSFQAPGDTGGAAIDTYTATCHPIGGGATGAQSGSGSPLTVSGLTNGRNYTCTVTAHNAKGTGSPSVQSATITPATTPSAPGNIVATPRDSSVIVSWSAPDDGGSAITQYVITYTPGDKTVSVGGGSLTTTVTGLHNGVAYAFTVAASNDVGTGPASVETGPVTPNLLDIEGEVIAATANGYWFATADGKVASFGDAKNYGGLTKLPNAFIIGLEPTPDMLGYWLVASDGGIFAFGDANFYGSTGAIKLNKPIVGMASSASGQGYWLVASDGGIFAYGDANFYGSTGAIKLNKPIVGMSPTPTGDGYWLVATDGGIFAYGDANFLGSAGAIHLNKPIVGMDRTSSGKGYWLVATDGGVFSYGEAPFYGSTGAMRLNKPIIGMAATPTGKGYWFVAADAGLFSFGDAPFFGPALGAHAFFDAHPVTGMSASRAGG